MNQKSAFNRLGTKIFNHLTVLISEITKNFSKSRI